jgi:opacity protein-like surface antigen
LSPNPRGFITFSDKAELDVTAHNPSFILRNPIYIDGTALITTLAVEYPDWKVNNWSLPKVGATIAYVHGKHSVYLTTSAGRGNFELSQGHIESRYEEHIVLYTQYTF